MLERAISGLVSVIFERRVQVLRRRVQKWSYAPPRGAEVVYACSTEYSSAAAYGRGRPGFPAQASELFLKSDFRLNTDFGMKLSSEDGWTAADTVELIPWRVRRTWKERKRKSGTSLTNGNT